MLKCYQFQTMNILEHGESVAAWFKDLHAHLTTGTPLQRAWKLPDWIYDPLLKQNLFDFDLLETYQIYHDCGKPLCRTVDAEGRQHFPNHVALSAQRWLECSDNSDQARQIGRLIAMDMDIHTVKSTALEEFARRLEAASLLLTGLCEIHSNAEMFGGMASTSFKIKWKHINRAGKRILERMKMLQANES